MLGSRGYYSGIGGGGVAIAPPEKIFSGVRFVLVGFDSLSESQYGAELIRRGGTNEGVYNPSCTHVIVCGRVYDDPVCVVAREDGKVVVTEIWVDDCVNYAMLTDATKILYRPVKDLNGIYGTETLCLCLTGYQRQEREYIMKMVSLMGARFSKPLVANQVTHLICYRFEGEKYELAKRVNIKLVNHQWLEDCLKVWEILPVEDYTKSGWELEVHNVEAGDAEDKTDRLSTERQWSNGAASCLRAGLSRSKDTDLSASTLEVNLQQKMQLPEEKKETQKKIVSNGIYLKSISMPNLENLANQECHNNTAEKVNKVGVRCARGDMTSIGEVLIPQTDYMLMHTAPSVKIRSPSVVSPDGIFTNESHSRGAPSQLVSLGDLSNTLCSALERNLENTIVNAELHASTLVSSNDNPRLEHTLVKDLRNPTSHQSALPGTCFPPKRNVSIHWTSFKSPRSVFEDSTATVPKDCSTSNMSIDSIGYGQSVVNCGVLEENNNNQTPIGNSLDGTSFSIETIKNSAPISPRMEAYNQARPSFGIEVSTSTYATSNKMLAAPSCTDGLRKAVNEPLHEANYQKHLESVSSKCGSLQGQAAVVRQNDAQHDTKSFLDASTTDSKCAGEVSTVLSVKEYIVDSRLVAKGEPNGMLMTHCPVNNLEKSRLPKKLEQDETVISSDSRNLDTERPISRAACANSYKEKFPSASLGMHIRTKMVANRRSSHKLNQRKGNVELENDHNLQVKGESHLDNRKGSQNITLFDLNGPPMTEDVLMNGNSKKICRDTIAGKEKYLDHEKEKRPNCNKVLHVKSANRKRKTPTGKQRSHMRICAEDTGKDKMKRVEVNVFQPEETIMLGNNEESCKDTAIEKDTTSDHEKENRPNCDNGLPMKDNSHKHNTPSGKVESPLRIFVESICRDTNKIHARPRKHLESSETSWFILSGTRPQRKEFQSLIRRLRGKLCKDSHHWSYQATHFIATNPIRRTEKFFAAAAAGRWILKTEYLTASSVAGKFLDEEPYEWHSSGLSEDGAISLEAPRKWRCLRQRTGHGVFYGMRIIIYGACVVPNLDTLKRVLKVGDGTLLATSPPYTRFLKSRVDFALVNQSIPFDDPWIQGFVQHEIPCITADYLVEYVCKPGYSLEKHVLYKTHAWAQRSLASLMRCSEEIVKDRAVSAEDLVDDLCCSVCRSRDRGDVMLICGDEKGSEGCGIGCHIDCCNPSLASVPEEDWFCPMCRDSVYTTPLKRTRLSSA